MARIGDDRVCHTVERTTAGKTRIGDDRVCHTVEKTTADKTRIGDDRVCHKIEQKEPKNTAFFARSSMAKESSLTLVETEIFQSKIKI